MSSLHVPPEGLKQMLLSGIDIVGFIHKNVQDYNAVENYLQGIHLTNEELDQYLSMLEQKLQREQERSNQIHQDLINELIPNILLAVYYSDLISNSQINRLIQHLSSLSVFYVYQNDQWASNLLCTIFESSGALITVFMENMAEDFALRLLKALKPIKFTQLKQQLLLFLSNIYRDDPIKKMKYKIKKALLLWDVDQQQSMMKMYRLNKKLVDSNRVLLQQVATLQKNSPPMRMLANKKEYIYELQYNQLRKFYIGPQICSRGPACTILQDGSLFICGGHPEATCIIDQTYQVHQIPQMQHNRRALAIVPYKNFVFVFGGHDGQRYVLKNEVFDSTHRTWSYIADSPEARNSTTAALYKDVIYYGGGLTENEQPATYVYKYLIQENIFIRTRIRAYSNNDYGCQLIVHDDTLFILCGYDGKEVRLEDEEEIATYRLGAGRGRSIIQPPYYLDDWYYFGVNWIGRFNIKTKESEGVCIMP